MTFTDSKLRIVLVAPRIAQNVGSITRTAYALNAELHLVRPFGFFWDEKKARRGSVGYTKEIEPKIYRDSEAFWAEFPKTASTEFYWATKGGKAVYSNEDFGEDVVLIFGNEEEGVPENFWQIQNLPNIVDTRIPTENVRCLNLAISVGVLGFEVKRQWGKKAALRQGELVETKKASNVWL